MLILLFLLSVFQVKDTGTDKCFFIFMIIIT